MFAVTVTTSDLQILPASPDRDRTYLIQPDGDIYLCMDGSPTPVTTSNGIKVPSGNLFSSASLGDARLARNAVRAIAASSINTRVQSG